MICPICKSEARELVVCEDCEAIGCARCIVPSGRRWLCEKCRNQQGQGSESSVMKMFD